MRTIYSMDTKLPSFSDYSKLHSFHDIVDSPISAIDTSYTKSFQSWIKDEFELILRDNKSNCKFNFSDILFTYYIDDSYNNREGFFDSTKNLIAVKAYNYTTGRESSLQRTAIHESTHAVTSQFSIVGLAFAEGIACYMEDLYCMSHNIPIDDGSKKDEGYIFSKSLVKNVILNVYNGNYNDFFEKVKKGNEIELLNDLDIFLSNKGILYNSRELLKFSSFLFYAKELPSSPFIEYSPKEEMEILRNEILKCFNENEKINSSSVLYDYYGSISSITKIFDDLKSKVNNASTFTKYVDERIGSYMAKYGANKILDTNFIVNVFDSIDYDCDMKNAKFK